MVSPSATSRALRVGWVACLFALVLGSRWAVVDRYGSDLPQWDQWDAEGLHVLVPWYSHHASVEDFLRPQNEHRVVLTKLLNFGLTVANGQWDQRLECACNAGLAALLAVGLFVFGRRHLPGYWPVPFFLLVVALLAAPIAWHNVVAGFHSQQFFLIGLSFGAIAWLPRAQPWSGRWWLGASCAILALGSMGSGFFAAVVAGGLIVLRVVRREVTPGGAVPTLALCGAVTLVGWVSRVTVPWHDVLRARHFLDYYLSILHSLQWPLLRPAPARFAVFLWLPWVLLAVGLPLAKKSRPDDGLGLVALGLGGWVILQIVATAYARGAEGVPPASRYFDTLGVGATANGLALAWLARDATGRWRAGCVLLAAGWLAAFATGYWTQLKPNLEANLPVTHSEDLRSQDTTRNYVATGNKNFLRTGKLPYPGVDGFLDRIDLPELRRLLPVSVRAPVALQQASSPGSLVRLDTRVPFYAEPDALAFARPSGPTGLSPATPLLENRVSWGSFGSAGQWASAPIQLPGSGWLKFEVAGQLGASGTALELRAAGTRALLAEVTPTEAPGDAWVPAFVPKPREDFVVVARTEDPAHWFAFSEPVEMGALSYRAWRAVRQGRLIAEIALGVALLLLAAEGWQRRAAAP